MEPTVPETGIVVRNAMIPLKEYCGGDADFSRSSKNLPREPAIEKMAYWPQHKDIDGSELSKVSNCTSGHIDEEIMLTDPLNLESEAEEYANCGSGLHGDERLMYKCFNTQIIVKSERGETSSPVIRLITEEKMVAEEPKPKIPANSGRGEEPGCLRNPLIERKVFCDQLNPEVAIKTEPVEATNPEAYHLTVKKEESDCDQESSGGLDAASSRSTTSRFGRTEIIVGAPDDQIDIDEVCFKEESVTEESTYSSGALLEMDSMEKNEHLEGTLHEREEKTIYVKIVMAPPKQSGPNRMPLAVCKPTRSVLLDTKPTAAKMTRCSECHSYFNLGNNYSVKLVRVQAVKDEMVCRQPEKEAQCGMENKPKSHMTVETLTLKCKMCAKGFRDSLSQPNGTVNRSVQDHSCCAGCVPKTAVPQTVVAHKRELRPEDARFLCLQCARRLGMCHKDRTSKATTGKHRGPLADRLSPPAAHRSSFKCRHCGMVLRSKRRLEVHERKHSVDFTCQTCGQRFSQFKPCHLCTHGTWRPRLCHFCGLLFSKPQAYHIHRWKEEEKNKPTDPSDSTPRPRHVRSNYQNFVNGPAVEQLYTCHICKIWFEQESLHQLHLVKVHGEKVKPSGSSEAPQLREVR